MIDDINNARENTVDIRSYKTNYNWC